ncbi:MAG: undecaprenyl-diphosphatase UppP [Thermoanaerobaculia bacterium]
MSTLQAVVLGLVQGLTEYLPISSTAHLRIIPALIGWKDPGAAASAVIQLGTVLAVIIYFFRDIVAIIVAFVRGIVTGKPFADPEARLGWYIGIGTIPVVVLGLGLKKWIETTFRSLWIEAFSLILLALVLGVAELWARKRAERTMEDVSIGDSLSIGFAQCLALVPGMSRSGSTIMAGLFRKMTHEGAARFSFLLGIPAIFGAGVYELIGERHHLAELGWGSIAISIAVSFVVGWASIYFLLRFLKTHTTWVFIWYRIALGVLVIGLLLAGILKPV